MYGTHISTLFIPDICLYSGHTMLMFVPIGCTTTVYPRCSAQGLIDALFRAFHALFIFVIVSVLILLLEIQNALRTLLMLLKVLNDSLCFAHIRRGRIGPTARS